MARRLFEQKKNVSSDCVENGDVNRISSGAVELPLSMIFLLVHCSGPGLLLLLLLLLFLLPPPLLLSVFLSLFFPSWLQIDQQEWCHLWAEYAQGRSVWQDQYMDIIFSLHDVSGWPRVTR